MVHAYNSATTAVFHLMMSELKVLEAAIREASKPPSAKREVEQEKPPDGGKEEKGAKGKKAKVVTCTLAFSPGHSQLSIFHVEMLT